MNPADSNVPEKTGDSIGFTILLVLATLSAFAMYLHAYALAAIFFSAPVVALVYLLITGNTSANSGKEK